MSTIRLRRMDLRMMMRIDSTTINPMNCPHCRSLMNPRWNAHLAGFELIQTCGCGVVVGWLASGKAYRWLKLKVHKSQIYEKPIQK